MTKQQYRRARRILRDNGRYGFKWLAEPVQSEMRALSDIQDSKDALAERADIVAYCKRQGYCCSIRHTGPVRYL